MHGFSNYLQTAASLVYDVWLAPSLQRQHRARRTIAKSHVRLKLNLPQSELHKNVSPPMSWHVSISGDYAVWLPRPEA